MPQWTRRQLALQLAAFVALLAVAPHLARAAAPPGPEARAFMTRAFAMLDAAVAAGDQPYGAVVVLDGRIVGGTASAFVRRGDSGAHAEREALADARRRPGRDSLAGTELYSSSRPCALCEAAAAQAGVARMVHGSDLADAGPPRMTAQ